MPFKVNPKDSKINQKYYRVCGKRNICKVSLNKQVRYELWDAGKYLGYEASFDEAVKSEKWNHES